MNDKDQEAIVEGFKGVYKASRWNAVGILVLTVMLIIADQLEVHRRSAADAYHVRIETDLYDRLRKAEDRIQELESKIHVRMKIMQMDELQRKAHTAEELERELLGPFKLPRGMHEEFKRKIQKMKEADGPDA